MRFAVIGRSDVSVHPSAMVDPAARIGERVRIGAGAIVEADVVIGDDCVIDAYAVVRRGVRMGRGNRLHPFCVIGGDPQDLGFDRTTPSRVDIGDDNEFREHVTIHRATRANGATRLGSGCLIMNHAHVAHDCVVGDGCIMANGVQLGGHVGVGAGVVFGGGAMVHQFCRVGSRAMVAAMVLLRKDVLPYTLVGGEPVRHYRVNRIGLQRAGMSDETIAVVGKAMRALRRSGNRSIGPVGNFPELEHLREWLAAPSRRGIYGWVGSSRS